MADGSWWNNGSTLTTHSVQFSQLSSATQGSATATLSSATQSATQSATVNSEVLHWQEATDWTYKIGSPLIIVCGTTGNILTLLVLRRMRSENSSFHLFFTALALSDLSLIYTGLMPVWVRNTFHFSLHDTYQVLCKLYFWLFYTFGGLSAWLLSALTIQRAVSVVWPHRVRSSCTKGQAYITIATIVSITAVIQFHLVFFVEINPQAGLCFFTSSYVQDFLNVFLWLDLMVQSFLPFCVLLLSNSVLVWSVVRSLRQARQTLAGGTGAEQVTAREKNLSSMTVTLIAVSAAFAILTSPIACLSLYTFYLGEVDADHHIKYPFKSFLAAFSNLLWYINSCINFFLYILTGSHFRQELKKMLGLAGKSGTNRLPGKTGVNRRPAEAAVIGNGGLRGSSANPKSSEEF